MGKSFPIHCPVGSENDCPVDSENDCPVDSETSRRRQGGFAFYKLKVCINALFLAEKPEGEIKFAIAHGCFFQGK